MPIVMNKEEWTRIVKWTSPDPEDPDVVRRREHVRRLDETSKLITKDWPNSLENVNKRNEELRRERTEAAEAANTNFYKKYVKRQQYEQRRLMHSARDIIFKNKDAPKLLLSAVLETVTQKEREEQVKFLKELRRQDAADKRRDDDEVIAKSVAWHELQATRKQRRFEVNKQHQKEILDQANEISERNRKEYEEELTLQKIDNIKAQEEIAAIKKFEADYKAAEKARIWSDMQRAGQELEQRRAEQKAIDDMDDGLIKVLVNSKKRIDKKRKETEQQIKEERLRVLEQISLKLESGDAAREAKEEAAREKTRQEKEQIDKAKRDALKRKEETFRAQRRASREQFLKEQAQKKHEEETMKNWSVMNRFKNEEIYEDFQEKLRLERIRKIKEHREDILKQWRERSDREAREVAERRYFYGELASKGFRHADNKLLTHAAALLDEAKRNGRPQFALHRAIDQYCKLYRLYPMPDLPRSMQEHFRRYKTWDGSKPDPDYREPPPPQMEEPVNTKKTNGLQDVHKPKQAAPVAHDFKRQAPVNGLEARTSQGDDVTLPAVTVRPCLQETCRCGGEGGNK